MRRRPTRSRGLVSAAVALTLLAAAAPTALRSAEDEGPQVALRWALGALDTSGSGKPTAIQRDTQLETGTRLKFLVEPLSPGSVYLLLLDSSDEIHVLYRETGKLKSQEGGEPTYIPPGTQWFELDEQAGMETFFLLASVEPLTELEAMLDRYAKADADARPALNREIVAEIRQLNKEYRNFARPVERPVMIGGQTRSSGGAVSASAIDQLAVEVEAERFYGKTITIDH